MKLTRYLLLAPLAAACSRLAEPMHLPLARGLYPILEFPAADAGEGLAWGPGLTLHLVPRADGAWLEERFEREDWTHLGSGIWRAARALPVGLERGAGELPELRGPSGALRRLPAAHWGHALVVLEANAVPEALLAALAEDGESPAFCCTGGGLYLVHAAGDEPPAPLVLRSWVGWGRDEQGSWCVPLAGLWAQGVPLLAGSRVTLPASHDMLGSLNFSIAGLARESTGVSRFTIERGGEAIFEHRVELTNEPSTTFHRVRLTGSGELRFRLDGPPALGAFLNPVLEPVESGTHGERRAPRDRPDVVLFVADTFRADNLAVHGGDPRVAPHLNALAERSVVFEQARAPSSWTYPSHASLLSGLYPRQAGTIRRTTTLAEEAHTLAEHLAARGYRTAAVTERGYVSRAFGLAQGFERFDEHQRDLERTLAKAAAALDADDGRPLFLFVHSYRAHHPYTVGEETRRRLAIEGDFHEFEAERLALPAPIRGRAVGGRQAELLGRKLALYRGASAELDAGFGRFLELLAERGSLDSAFLIFTSDHGEAFGEHGVVGHGSAVFEEILRVPLLIHGSGLEPRRVPHPAGLTDLPRTLCALLGLEPHAEWMGDDLMSLDADRPAFAWQCTNSGKINDVAWIAEGRKLVLRASVDTGEVRGLRHAYDLRHDPRETRDQYGLPSQRAAWPEQLREALAPRAESLCVPLLGAEAGALDPSQEAHLRAMGYGGGE